MAKQIAPNPLKCSTLSAGLMGIQELSDLLGMAKSTITKWDGKGHLPTSFRVGPRKDRRWSRNEITHWLKFSSIPVDNDSPFRNMN
jgi:predicted DNA-binding transcriptional regulator AlpA